MAGAVGSQSTVTGTSGTSGMGRSQAGATVFGHSSSHSAHLAQLGSEGASGGVFEFGAQKADNQSGGHSCEGLLVPGEFTL